MEGHLRGEFLCSCACVVENVHGYPVETYMTILLLTVFTLQLLLRANILMMKSSVWCLE